MTLSPAALPALVTALVGGMLAVLGAAAPSHGGVDRDCSDFDTQAQAQSFFLDHDPAADPHRLDSDGDRIACETNPCPCSTNTGSSGETASTVLRQRGRVVKVVDGDTVDVRLSATGAVRRVRMIGIDTPERDRCGYTRATRSMRTLAPVGTRVLLVSDPSQALRDRYGRLLRYVVRRSDARDLNRAQLAKGMARVFVFADDPFRRVATYRDAQYAARTHDRGLWATCW